MLRIEFLEGKLREERTLVATLRDRIRQLEDFIRLIAQQFGQFTVTANFLAPPPPPGPEGLFD